MLKLSCRPGNPSSRPAPRQHLGNDATHDTAVTTIEGAHARRGGWCADEVLQWRVLLRAYSKYFRDHRCGQSRKHRQPSSHGGEELRRRYKSAITPGVSLTAGALP